MDGCGRNIKFRDPCRKRQENIYKGRKTSFSKIDPLSSFKSSETGPFFSFPFAISRMGTSTGGYVRNSKRKGC